LFRFFWLFFWLFVVFVFVLRARVGAPRLAVMGTTEGGRIVVGVGTGVGPVGLRLVTATPVPCRSARHGRNDRDYWDGGWGWGVERAGGQEARVRALRQVPAPVLGVPLATRRADGLAVRVRVAVQHNLLRRTDRLEDDSGHSRL